MVVTSIQYKKALWELTFLLRNADIFTITQRGVTTTAATGTFSATASFTISKNNVKNIRSVVVASVTLKYGRDYTVDTEATGATVCIITFTSAQTGAYTITYDWGTDKIYPDNPREDLTISSFPRIAVGMIGADSEVGGFGNVNVTDIEYSITVYDTTTNAILDYLTAARQVILNNQTTLYYLASPIRPTRVGPLLKSPREQGKDKVWQMNQDFVSMFNYEK